MENLADSTIEEYNKVREQCGLPLLQPTVRVCDICKRDFRSESKFNRRCSKCKTNKDSDLVKWSKV